MMAITSLYSESENEWKNTTPLDVRRLHEQNPAQLLTKNKEGQLPLHFAVTCATFEVICDLLQLCKKSAEIREDIQKRTIDDARQPKWLTRVRPRMCLGNHSSAHPRRRIWTAV